MFVYIKDDELQTLIDSLRSSLCEQAIVEGETPAQQHYRQEYVTKVLIPDLRVHAHNVKMAKEARYQGFKPFKKKGTVG